MMAFLLPALSYPPPPPPHPPPPQDLVIPAYKRPQNYAKSPLLGKKPVNRTILAFFRGDMGHEVHRWAREPAAGCCGHCETAMGSCCCVTC
jgi:hypothetical protein